MNRIEEKKIELIEALMEEKYFEDLSEVEQNLVLEVLKSKEEFDEMKEIERQLSQQELLYNDTPDPNPEIFSKIRNAYFKDTKPKRI